MHTIVLWDKTEIVVSDEKAAELKAHIDDIEHFEVDGEWIKASAVARIKEGGEVPKYKTIDDDIKKPRPMIGNDDRSDEMGTEWVKAYYSGDKAKRAAALAGEGVGYFILHQEKTSVVVAFLRPLDSPRPHHLEGLTDLELRRVSEAYKHRFPNSNRKSPTN